MRELSSKYHKNTKERAINSVWEVRRERKGLFNWVLLRERNCVEQKMKGKGIIGWVNIIC